MRFRQEPQEGRINAKAQRSKDAERSELLKAEGENRESGNGESRKTKTFNHGWTPINTDKNMVVGRVTPCAPFCCNRCPGAHGMTHPTNEMNWFTRLNKSHVQL